MCSSSSVDKVGNGGHATVDATRAGGEKDPEVRSLKLTNSATGADEAREVGDADESAGEVHPEIILDSMLSGKMWTSAKRGLVSVPRAYHSSSLTSWLIPAILQNEVLNLQIFFAVFDRKMKVAVSMCWSLVCTACWWAAGSTWTGRQTWCWWRWRVEISNVIHLSIVIHHNFWCWH